jgi:hypothetical protein
MPQFNIQSRMARLRNPQYGLLTDWLTISEGDSSPDTLRSAARKFVSAQSLWAVCDEQLLEFLMAFRGAMMLAAKETPERHSEWVKRHGGVLAAMFPPGEWTMQYANLLDSGELKSGTVRDNPYDPSPVAVVVGDDALAFVGERLAETGL